MSLKQVVRKVNQLTGEGKIKGVLKKSQIPAITLLLIIGISAEATVFINEVFINPPGPSEEGDANHEFIELLGVPGRKLDGYAIAVMNGMEEKLYPLDSIPPIPDPASEIDQLFSLDGLSLGSNGLLVLVIRNPNSSYYPELLSDSNFANWMNLWNGGLMPPSQLDNNGSFTIMLVRNRPGQTEADPCNPAGLLWGKEIAHDAELITPVNGMDQWGDGNLDRGQNDGLGGNTLEMTGLSTTGDLTDDLEVVDEVSYEDRSGWEYDTDGRHVDSGSTRPGLPYRHIHALDDPDGFNPDAISRVDYRTKGNGWTPATSGIGEMSNGNNWQDTATDQWIRGNSEAGLLPEFGLAAVYFYENFANLDPCAVQPYKTNVPLWLDDGSGNDYDFSTINTYQIAPGRINSLAVPFIPGDFDRDGDCDGDDIAKTAAVFGDDDWIFSNSFWDAPEGDEVDPNTQTKPWDVDATGDNGIEATDLQWALNFQGDTAGQIVGVQYDSTSPAASGVVLNANMGIECTVTASVNIPSGRTLSALIVGDIVEITVEGEVSAGANSTSGEENGIMQYIHDAVISSSGIIKVISIEALGSFNTTRASIEQKQGTNGDLGIELINGFTTSFTEGLSGTAELYRVTLQAIGGGSCDLSISAASSAKFAAGSGEGLKIGHTNSNGGPDSAFYPGPLSITVIPEEDIDGDGSISLGDLMVMNDQWLGIDPNEALLLSCVGNWKMNDYDPNKTVRDSSGNANDGVSLQNTDVLHTAGKIDGALMFNGTSDYVNIGNVISPGAYTKTTWVKREAGSNYNNIISSGDISSHAFWAPSSQSFKLSAGHNGSWYLVQDSVSLDADVWYHVAVTFDPDVDSGRMVLYKNGVEVDAETAVVTHNPSTITYIGKYRTDYYFKGSIDNVMVFDRALTAEEIEHLYNKGNGIEGLVIEQMDADINGDGDVDFLDFAKLGAAW